MGRRAKKAPVRVPRVDHRSKQQPRKEKNPPHGQPQTSSYGRNPIEYRVHLTIIMTIFFVEKIDC